MSMMKISMIAALAENGVIGINNQLPWHLPGDLKYFKSVTMGKPLVMGRKTFESLGKPLPGRPHIILTRDKNFHTDYSQQCHVANSLEEVVAIAEDLLQANTGEEFVVIGGAEIYKLMLPMADRLYLTEVHAKVEGDTFFPVFDRSEWNECGRESFKSSETNPFDYSFVILERTK